MEQEVKNSILDNMSDKIYLIRRSSQLESEIKRFVAETDLSMDKNREQLKKYQEEYSFLLKTIFVLY